MKQEACDLVPDILSDYDQEVTRLIMDKYNMGAMESLRAFLGSKTYGMLQDERLRMWEFSPAAIFEMWECERIAGDPRTSAYLR